MSEFSLIEKYFTRPASQTDLGVGDDAALVRIAEGMQLAISSDMLVAGTHFLHDCAPYDIGWKALAVNVSDMAAMGAQPKWATLAIALPEINQAWLAEFSRGFFACADAFNIDLIGGDTTSGPLNISVTIMGEVPLGAALQRDGAQIGDDIWVSGNLGSAALGLAHLQEKLSLTNELETCLNALHTPTPRAALGLALRGIATSCIDVSDGLLADLGHILKASNCGATIDLEKIPCIDLLKNDLQNSQFQTFILAGGDDYELCFTASPKQREAINLLSKQIHLPITNIGTTNVDIGLQAYYKNNQLKLLKQGFDHFA
ncbi:MAG: thiamine-phosphate kinase [Bdellovibrio sp.]|nr:thiamine-phosphate kinase [Methylotenera sp.]